jgi:hypothetical protein
MEDDQQEPQRRSTPWQVATLRRGEGFGLNRNTQPMKKECAQLKETPNTPHVPKKTPSILQN